MCEQFGSCCQLCKLGLVHDAPKKTNRKAEFWRQHHSLALLVGKDEVADFEKHYAQHGICVDHRPTGNGDYEPVITSRAQFDAMLKSRGLHDRG